MLESSFFHRAIVLLRNDPVFWFCSSVIWCTPSSTPCPGMRRRQAAAWLPSPQVWCHRCDISASFPIVVVQSLSRVWLCDPRDCSMPGSSFLHYVPEFAQTHVPWVDDTIQPSHPLPSSSPPAFSLSQNQGLFNQSVLCIRWSKYWSFSTSPSVTEFASLCARCAVRPINMEHQSLEQRRVYYRFIQGEGWLMP